MSSNLFSELERTVVQQQNQNALQTNNGVIGCGNSNLIEDQRALQLAFELSMLGLSDTLHGLDVNGIVVGGNNQNAPSPTGGCMSRATPSSLAALSNGRGLVGDVNGLNNPGLCALGGPFSNLMTPGMDERSKKSQNMTECVPVPSSEHVAEIVGRQGCKIKALRAKTNTYIKTPVRGEEPVFVVTGRKEDVAKAKLEILSAAEHFSLIRASRKPTFGGLSKGIPPGPPAIPGQVTSQIRVPYRVVGLVVGPKGATIKHIQQQTDTYIVTPSRDKEPVFEVTGQPENVAVAERQIKAHIEMRTGQAAQALAQSGMGGMLSDESAPELLASLYKNGLGSLLGYLEPSGMNGDGGSGGGGNSSNSSSASSTSSKSCALMTRPELISIWKTLGGDSIDVDEGIGESPNIWSATTPTLIGSRSSPSASASPTDSLLGGQTNKRECLVCGDKEITAALVPCGHNLFCLDCANQICISGNALCPVCSQTVVQAIRILG